MTNPLFETKAMLNITLMRIGQLRLDLVAMTYGLDQYPDEMLARELSALIKGFDKAVRDLAQEAIDAENRNGTESA